MPDTKSTPVDHEVGIIGAGFGGIIAGLALQRAGRDSFVIFERADAIGGVWRDNVYPGCACDTKSSLYSVAAQPNAAWRSSYSSQPDILQYLHDIVGGCDLERHIRLGAEVSQLRFRDDEGHWEVIIKGHPTCRVKAIILATGPLSRPSVPNIEGMHAFEGAIFHTSCWDNSAVIAGKRVAVVGTGASAIQVVPAIAPAASQLLVFQRTAQWVMPRLARRILPVERWLFRKVPVLQAVVRGSIYWLNELIGWGLVRDGWANRLLAALGRLKLALEVSDPVTRRRLTPDHKIGCKRVLVSDDYLPTFNRRNVELVSEPILRLEPRGIRTADGRLREVDVIVLATGFKVGDLDGFLDVAGRDGRKLKAEWTENGAQAYLGLNVSGFPNFAMLLGPNSGIGHSSVLHIMEFQMDYVTEYLALLDKATGGSFVDVRPEAQERYNVALDALLNQTVQASGCRSWYQNSEGKNVALYPGLSPQYRRVISRFRGEDYEVVRPRVDAETAGASDAAPATVA